MVRQVDILPRVLDNMLNIKIFRQFVIYGAIGVSVNFLGYLLYLLLVYWFFEPKLAMTLLYFIGVLFSFFANRRFTFADQRGVKSSGWRFLLSYCVGYLIDLLLLLVFVDMLHYPHEWVQGVAVIVVAFFLFFVSKFYVFKDSSSIEVK